MIKDKAIARKSLYIEKLKEHFGTGDTFHVSDIAEFYRKFEEEPKRATVDWRIHELKSLGVLQKVGRGEYSLEKGAHFQPEIEKPMIDLFRKINSQFPYLKVCLWSTKWLNQFMQHQPGRFNLLVETGKDAMETVFFFLKEKKYDVFLDPSEEVLNYYAFDKKEIIIVTRLIKEAPLLTLDGVPTATLEKILVDVFCDKVLFSTFQGDELSNIFRNAFQNHLIDNPKLLRYASRRRRREEIQAFWGKIQS